MLANFYVIVLECGRFALVEAVKHFKPKTASFENV